MKVSYGSLWSRNSREVEWAGCLDVKEKENQEDKRGHTEGRGPGVRPKEELVRWRRKRCRSKVFQLSEFVPWCTHPQTTHHCNM